MVRYTMIVLAIALSDGVRLLKRRGDSDEQAEAAEEATTSNDALAAELSSGSLKTASDENSTADYHKVADWVYCSNRGGQGGRNVYTKNVGANNVNACADYVKRTPECGNDFNYGLRDGWCDCVPMHKGPCNVYPYRAEEQYSVYQLQDPSKLMILHQASDSLCLNRAGVGGSTPYSTNVGPNRPWACALKVRHTAGCGPWFNYQTLVGWCDCVKAVDGPCNVVNYQNHVVYSFTEAPTKGAGAWVSLRDLHGGTTRLSIIVGTQYTSTYQTTREWAAEVTSTFSAKMSVGAKFLGIGTELEAERSLSRTMSSSVASQSSRSWTQNVAEGVEEEFTGTGTLWQWQVRIGLSDGTAVQSETNNYAITSGLRQPPRCVPGHAQDIPAYQICTTPAAVIGGR